MKTNTHPVCFLTNSIFILFTGFSPKSSTYILVILIETKLKAEAKINCFKVSKVKLIVKCSDVASLQVPPPHSYVKVVRDILTNC